MTEFIFRGDFTSDEAFNKYRRMLAENEELKKDSECLKLLYSSFWVSDFSKLQDKIIELQVDLQKTQQKATQGERLREELEKIIKDADKNTKYFDVEETRGYDCCIGDIKSILNQSKEPTT